MNISYNWLKEFVNFNLSPDETATVLTSIGLENGPVEEVETIKGGLEGLVIGEVLTCESHPDSDHLHLTTVNIGNGEPLNIVCGAPNVAAGQKVIVATIGTKLFSGDESFVIKKSKIRGKESFGMICAEDEIGIGTSHDGIIVLPEDTKVGMTAKEYYGIDSEFILEVDITPNRADAASHFGVARDLAAYLKQKDSSVILNRPSVDSFSVDNKSYVVDVKVEDSEACPRYSGVTVSNVKVGESPEWLKKRLQLIGLRPINNIVDITNYLLHETGQPLHAFDGAKIKGDKIIVKTVSAGNKFTTLDQVERSLDEKDLMICNEIEPMCIGGVFGGLDSGVSETTTKVFIESAYFNPVSIRKTARRHGLNTDSSFRFERGVDPNNTLYVLKRAALMIKEIAGGEISSEIIDIYPEKIEDFAVSLSLKKVNTLIGKDIPVEDVRSILEALEIKILSEKDGVLDLVVPSYRVDVQRDVDVIEDILRIYGYNNIDFSDTVRSSISYSQKPDSNKIQNIIADQLTANGFNEILNNSLTSVNYYKNINHSWSAENCVSILNPLSNDLAVMRQSLLFGGLESISYNKNRRNSDLKLYEFGNCYHYNSENKKEGDVLAEYSEEFHLGLWISGYLNDLQWNKPQVKVSVYDLKTYFENILMKLGIKKDQLVLEEGDNETFAHSLSYKLRNGKILAIMGKVRSSILKEFDIDDDVYYGDILWENLLAATKKNTVRFSELPKFPEVRRDLALLVDQSVKYSDVEKIAFSTDKKILKSVALFDVYEGKNLPEGKKSYAVCFILQDLSQTLTDNQIDAVMDKLTRNFEKQLGASLR
jgi:phenylalanyl-tRNA synthetase beta chain